MIVGIIFLILGILLVIEGVLDDKFLGRLAQSFGVIIIIISGIMLIIDSQSKSKPEAIDVYRDKTELQINYKVIKGDTIPTDSIVVWK